MNYIISNGTFYECASQTNDELVHYGVRGMKWGVRRYQNKDGSLTPAGKKRLSEHAGDYLNPPTKRVEKINLVPGPVRYKVKPDGNIKNRKEVSERYKNSYWDLMKKYGFGPEDGDGAELHEKLETVGKYRADDKLWNSYIKQYSEATLADLKIKDTVEARAYVESLFKKDLIDIPGYPHAKQPRQTAEEKERDRKLQERIWEAQEKSWDIRKSIKAEVDSKKYRTSDEKSKAADELYRKKMREAEEAGDTRLADEIWQQWNFSYDDKEWD